MERRWLLLLVSWQLLLGPASSKEITIQVNPRKLVQFVPERFLSMTIDPATILLAGGLKNDALNMAKGLSPSYVRLGGKSTNHLKFGKDLETDNTTITEGQWDSVNKFARQAGLDLIASINPTDRINGVWDSRDALHLISYSDKNGYNVAWQLGYDTEGISAPGAELGRDVIRLRKILDGFGKFTRSPVFAPDLPEVLRPKDAYFVRDLLIQAGPVLGAIFIQPPFRPDEDPSQTIMNTIVNLDTNVWGKALRFGRIIPRKPIWIAEREISSGTSEEAIGLMRRLGVAARIGIQVVMRQVGPRTINNPTPEFWTALLYKNLAGRGVLDAKVNAGQNRTDLHIFSHCTPSIPKERSIIDQEVAYDKGAVTVFGVNEGFDSIKISLKAGMKEEKVHVYSLTFKESGNKYEDTLLNGQKLSLSPSGELPIISPRVIKRASRSGVIIPARSAFFMVLPDVKSRVCSSTPSVSPEVQELSKKLIQVAAEVLDKPGALSEEEDDSGKVYVKFGQPSGFKTAEEEMRPPVEQQEQTLSEIDTTKTPVTTEVGVTDKSRRKRSAEEQEETMEPTTDSYYYDQDQLVEKFNRIAHKVYTSKEAETNPEDLDDLLKAFRKVRFSFKNLGNSTVEDSTTETTQDPEIETTQDPETETEIIEFPTELEPIVQEEEIATSTEDKLKDNENGVDGNLEEKNGQLDIVNEITPEDKQRVEKEAIYQQNGEEENSFRESKDRGSDNTEKGGTEEGVFQETVGGSEDGNAVKSAGFDDIEPKEELSRPDVLREGGDASESTIDGGVDGEETGGENDLGSEAASPDEPTESGGAPLEAKEGGSSDVLSDGIPSISATDPPKTPSEDNQEATDEIQGNTKPMEIGYMVMPMGPSPAMMSMGSPAPGLPMGSPAPVMPMGTPPSLMPSSMPMATPFPLMSSPFPMIPQQTEATSILGMPQLPTETPQLLESLTNDPKKPAESALGIDPSTVAEKDSSEITKKVEEEKPSNELTLDQMKQTPDELPPIELEKDMKGKKLENLLMEIASSNPEDEISKNKINNEIKPEIINRETKDGEINLNEVPEDDPTNPKSQVEMLGESIEIPDNNKQNSELPEGPMVQNDSSDSEDMKPKTPRQISKEESQIMQEVADQQKAEEEQDNSERKEEVLEQSEINSREVPGQEEGAEEDGGDKATSEKAETDDQKLMSSSENANEETAGEVNDKQNDDDSSSSFLAATGSEAGSENLESDDDKQDPDETEAKEPETEKRGKKTGEVGLLAKKLEERRAKLQMIKEKIKEAQEKFRKASIFKGDWQEALRSRNDDLRRKLYPGAESPETTPASLSRTRRLSYYPENGFSSEELYDYPPKRSIPSPPCSSCDTLSSAIGTQDGNHIIFPLDPKSTQAVVYDNKIIPAKLYGVINIDDPHSKPITTKPQPQPQPDDSFFTKYYTKAYDPPKEKFHHPISDVPKPYDEYLARSYAPKSPYLNKLDEDSDFIPVVVVSPKSGVYRRKRSLPLSPDTMVREMEAAMGPHMMRKRSISSSEEMKDSHLSNEIPHEMVKPIISNEIIPSENHEIIKVHSQPQPIPQSLSYDYMDPLMYPLGGEGKSEGRTFPLPPPLVHPLPSLLPPLRLPRPLPPPHYPAYPPLQRPFPGSYASRILPLSEPPIQNFSGEEHPSIQQSLPSPPPPPPVSHVQQQPADSRSLPGPPQQFFFNMLQDKFKSLMGMLDSLAVWCGADTK